MKQHSPACERNRGPILEVLREVFPPTGLVLEIAAGTGMHSVWFAPRLPTLTWQPTDIGGPALASIRAWRKEVEALNLLEPIRLDTRDPVWPVQQAQAALCCNMIHISPWESALGLLAGLGRVLDAGGVFVLYGPFRFDGVFQAPSNEAFDRSLRSRDPRWGVRDLGEVTAVAAEHGLVREEVRALPANNHAVVFRRG